MGKARYKNYWYVVSQTMVRRYPAIKKEKGIQSAIFTQAIEQALEELTKLSDSELRRKAIQLIYFDKTDTIDGVALKVHVSRRTVQRWCSAFINAVGRYAGFN